MISSPRGHACAPEPLAETPPRRISSPEDASCRNHRLRVPKLLPKEAEHRTVELDSDGKPAGCHHVVRHRSPGLAVHLEGDEPRAGAADGR